MSTEPLARVWHKTSFARICAEGLASGIDLLAFGGAGYLSTSEEMPSAKRSRGGMQATAAKHKALVRSRSSYRISTQETAQ